MDKVGDAIEKSLKELINIDGYSLKLRRRDKFLKIGTEA